MSTFVVHEGDPASQTAVTTFRLRTPTAELVGHEYAGEGDPIVMLHGGPGVPDYLGPVAALLAPRHRVITSMKEASHDHDFAESSVIPVA